MRGRKRYVVLALVWAGLLSGVVTPALCARPITLCVGESQVIGQPEESWQKITQIVVADPKVADVSPVSATSAVVLARAAGCTMVYVWDQVSRNYAQLYNYKIIVSPPGLQPVVEKIAADLAGYPGVKVRAVGETILLEGAVASCGDVAKVETIAKAHSPNVKNLTEVAPRDVVGAMNSALSGFNVQARVLDDGSVAVEGEVGSKEAADAVAATAQNWAKDVRIVNLVRQSPQPTKQVSIRAKVVEVNRTEVAKLGVDWWQTRTGASLPQEPQPFVIGGFGKGAPALVGPIEARIDALIRNDRASLLSEPRMTVTDGQTANILVGGEIPVPVVQGIGAGITIEWKDYGVSLDVTPRIGADDTVTLKVAPRVSGLDFANGIILSGFRVPALRTRKAETAVQVRNGETIVIGGLLQTDKSATVKKIPLLGDIPVLGSLFQSKSKQTVETELVIFVTPEIIASEVS